MNDWQNSHDISRTDINPSYQSYQNQLDLDGPAQHVDKINRGQYFNPELQTSIRGNYDADFDADSFDAGRRKI